ncbi:rap guanine nucleotide exchange factor 6 isoform X1 [Oreochromis niloticus]|uniref:rap guanine nucleotide exchange factor 6 isoform X1 n=1 Tax=Oreochromis niloticus TaxID=8128 RepID=UPI000DF11236|nr:rap guanine nucleotide exchange factor 6-like isoform X1 [Oreochromis niloticus]CAI5642961.1 unnamed protein product [Mustela putorius furo]
MKMTGAMETSFKQALKKPPSLRTAEDLHTIYCHLYHMDVLSHLREHQLRSMCTSARYEKHEANHVLFYPDTIATCWYILLSGSVFVKEHMYLARCWHNLSLCPARTHPHTVRRQAWQALCSADRDQASRLSGVWRDPVRVRLTSRLRALNKLPAQLTAFLIGNN